MEYPLIKKLGLDVYRIHTRRLDFVKASELEAYLKGRESVEEKPLDDKKSEDKDAAHD